MTIRFFLIELPRALLVDYFGISADSCPEVNNPCPEAWLSMRMLRLQFSPETSVRCMFWLCGAEAFPTTLLELMALDWSWVVS